MIDFRTPHRACRTALVTLVPLIFATTGAQAAPIQFNITDFGQLTGFGVGLDNDGQLIAEPVRDVVGELAPTDHPVDYGGNHSIIDGTEDGRLLVLAFGTGSVSSVPHTYVYDPHYAMPWGETIPTNLVLGANDGARWTNGVDMNTKGDVVGSAEWGGADATRLFYTAAGATTLQDLAASIPPDSGWKLTDVFSINDRGQILGAGVNPEGQTTDFLLTPGSPVPEPGAWAVFGLAAAFAWRNRRAG